MAVDRTELRISLPGRDTMSRNIVLVTVDSLRADHCGFMGYERDTTPTLDQLAMDGIVFENAIAPGPRTPESMPVIFTGEYPAEDLPTDMVPQREIIHRHMQTRMTLPERLSEQGYTTIGFSPNPFASRYFGFDIGFDHFQDFMSDSGRGLYQKLFRGWLVGDTLSNVMRLGRNMIQREEVFKPWESFYDEVIQRVRGTEEPYFLWVFLMDVHEPYLAGPGYRSLSWWERWSAIWQLHLGNKETPFDDRTTRQLVQAYDDSIQYTDAFFQNLQTDLSDDSPIILMHGDHGEGFGEHGTYSHEPYLYRENVHVPLLISGIGHGSIETPISLRQLSELLLTIKKGDADALGQSRGTESNSVIHTRTAADDKIALRSGRWKYIKHASGEELYDLTKGEQRSIVNGELATIHRTLTTSKRETEREYRRIQKASEELIMA